MPTVSFFLVCCPGPNERLSENFGSFHLLLIFFVSAHTLLVNVSSPETRGDRWIPSVTVLCHPSVSKGMMMIISLQTRKRDNKDAVRFADVSDVSPFPRSLACTTGMRIGIGLSSLRRVSRVFSSLVVDLIVLTDRMVTRPPLSYSRRRRWRRRISSVDTHFLEPSPLAEKKFPRVSSPLPPQLQSGSLLCLASASLIFIFLY